MTISSTTSKNTYNGDGSTLVFAYTFEVLLGSDLLVQVKNTSTGVITTKTINTDYTVSGAGSAGGGNVTFIVAPASGTVVILLRNVPYTQPSHYAEYTQLPSVTLETNLDRLTMFAQQLNEVSSRNIKVDAGVDTTVFDTTIPTPTSQGGQFLQINNAATGFAFSTLQSVGDYVFVAGTGLLAQTATGTATPRTLTGTSGQITVTDGNGAAGNPTISLPAALNLPGAINQIALTLASASTVNIGAAAANSINISGTTTITAFDSLTAGAIRYLEFQGILTLTHNASSLILPGAANITTAAGDTAIMQSLGSGNWRCLMYSKASGRSVISSGVFSINKVLITATGTYTPSANIISADVEVQASGGGGGYGTGAGGGGGGYARKFVTAAQIGATAAATIGTSGAHGTSGTPTGTTGGTTSLVLTGTGTLTISATGGIGGNGNSGSAAGGDGGTGTGGDENIKGQAGGYYLAASAINIGGIGGSSKLGLGGQASTGAGYPGTGYGGGGSGGANSSNGNDASPGLIRITEYILT